MGGGKLLEDASVEELIKELISRGFSGFVGDDYLKDEGESDDMDFGAPGDFDGASAFGGTASTIEDQVQLFYSVQHKPLENVYGRIDLYDWERSPPGLVSDALSSVVVGQTTEANHTDGGVFDVLVIKHYETERLFKDDWGEKMMPVWGVAWKPREFAMMADEARGANETLIHRECAEEDPSQAPWYSECHYLVEDGKTTGVKIVVKVTQDSEPHVRVVRFKMNAQRFKIVNTELLSQPKRSFESACAVPTETVSKLPELAQHLKEKPAIRTEPKIEGELELELKVKPGPPTSLQSFHHAMLHNEYNKSMLYMHMSTPVITIYNPAEKTLPIREVNVEYLLNGEWKQAETTVSGQEDGFSGGYSWNDGTPTNMKLEEYETVLMTFRGSFGAPIGGEKAYEGNNRHRIHHTYPSPLTYRAVFLGPGDKTKSIEFEYADEALDCLWNTYDEAVKTQKGDGLGDDYSCDLWLTAENPITLCKATICVTSAKKDAHEWYIRMTHDRRDLGGGHSYVGPDYFARLAYKAAKEGKTEVPLDLMSNPYCTLHALVDVEKKVCHALRGEIKITRGEEVVAHVTGHCKLDYKRVTPKEE